MSDYCVTDAPVGVRLMMSPSGASVGVVDDHETLLRAARRLVEEAHCTAIAVVCRFPDDDPDDDTARLYTQVRVAAAAACQPPRWPACARPGRAAL